MKFIQKPRGRNYIKVNNEEDFRDDVIFMSENSAFMLPLCSSYTNPYIYFELITKQLTAGNHQIRIDTLDDKNNENIGMVSNVIIPSRVLPPRFITATIINTTALISWEHSVDGPPDRYALFGTSDTSLAIDRVNEFNGISVDGNETSMVVELPVAGTYRFIIDSKIGTELSDNFITIDITSPSTAVKPPVVINQINTTDIDIGQLEVFSVNQPVGKLNVQFIWVFGDQCSSFNLYHDSGTGTVDFGSPINFIRQTSLIQNFTTDQISFDSVDTEYKFVIRSVSPDGVEDDNTFENSVLLNGSIPPDADDITITTCLC